MANRDADMHEMANTPEREFMRLFKDFMSPYHENARNRMLGVKLGTIPLKILDAAKHAAAEKADPLPPALATAMEAKLGKDDLVKFNGIMNRKNRASWTPEESGFFDAFVEKCTAWIADEFPALKAMVMQADELDGDDWDMEYPASKRVTARRRGDAGGARSW